MVYQPSLSDIGEASPTETGYRPSLSDIGSNEQPKENLSYSLLAALPRIGEDAIKKGVDFARQIPNYYEASKTEIPAAFSTLRQHPGHAALQALAGSQEMINNLAQLPKGIAEYGANRLNLVPKSVVNAVSAITPEDTTQPINALFGQPTYPGEGLIRGVARNSGNILGAGALVKTLNPLKLTDRGIAKSILNEEKRQMDTHTKAYNSIWDEAKKSGFDQVPVNEKKLSDHLSFIEKYKAPKEYKTLEELILNPTLDKAQKAQSDMGKIRRTLEKTSKDRSLFSEERKLLDSVSDAEKHIEGNMFKNEKGELNENLQKKYKKVSNSYAENVVPYLYNDDIQGYKDRKMRAKKLINSLSEGEFRVKKGAMHPQLALRELLGNPFAKYLGAGALGVYLYKNAIGENPSADK